MSIVIGNKDYLLANLTWVADETYAPNLAYLHQAITAEYKVTKFYARQSSSGDNTGKTVKIGVFDVSAGVDNAVQVGSTTTLTGTSTQSAWIEGIGGGEVALPKDKTYSVIAWSDGWLGWVGGDYTSNHTLVREGETDLLSPFVLNGSSYPKAYAFYADAELVVAASNPTITSVNGGASVADGDTNVSIVGTDFAASGNSVVISPSTDINDVDAVTQTPLTSESTTEIVITVDLPTGVSHLNPIYFFVTDDSSNVSDSHAGSVTEDTSTTLFTVELTDDGTPVSETGTLVPCESTDFAIGITIDVYRVATPSVKEAATLVTEVSNENTGTPQFNATLENGDLVSGDTFKYSYDGTGDIKAVTGGQPLAPFTDKVGTNCA